MLVTAKPGSPTCFSIAPDTGARLSIIDINLFRKEYPNHKVEDLNEPIACQGIAGDKLLSSQMTKITLYSTGHKPSGTKVIMSMDVTVRLVPHLSPGLLLGMDYLGPQGAIIDAGSRKITFPFMGGATTDIMVTPRKNVPNQSSVHKAKASKETTIPPKSAKRIDFYTNNPLPDGCDLEFTADDRPVFQGLMYNAVMNDSVKSLLVRNDSNKHLRIPRNARLGYIRTASIEGMYPLDGTDHGVAAFPGPKRGLDDETVLPNGITI